MNICVLELHHMFKPAKAKLHAQMSSYVQTEKGMQGIDSRVINPKIGKSKLQACNLGTECFKKQPCCTACSRCMQPKEHLL